MRGEEIISCLPAIRCRDEGAKKLVEYTKNKLQREIEAPPDQLNFSYLQDPFEDDDIF